MYCRRRWREARLIYKTSWLTLMNALLVSVIIPFYSRDNGRLLRAVESALDQTISEIEVIVVDDCSPVPAAQELESVSDCRLKILRHEVCRNGAHARNSGIEAACGRFIAFLDYDDIWHNSKLELQIALFEQLKDDKSVIYSQCNVVEETCSYIRPERAIRAGESVGDYLFVSKQIIQTSGIFLGADVAKAVRFDDLKRHQDYQFCLSLENYGCKFSMISFPLYDFIQIPKLNDYAFSMVWLERYRAYLSCGAIKGFLETVIMKSMISHGHYAKALVYAFKNLLFVAFIRFLIIRFVKNSFPGLVNSLRKLC